MQIGRYSNWVIITVYISYLYYNSLLYSIVNTVKTNRFEKKV